MKDNSLTGQLDILHAQLGVFKQKGDLKCSSFVRKLCLDGDYILSAHSEVEDGSVEICDHSEHLKAGQTIKFSMDQRGCSDISKDEMSSSDSRDFLFAKLTATQRLMKARRLQEEKQMSAAQFFYYTHFAPQKLEAREIEPTLSPTLPPVQNITEIFSVAESIFTPAEAPLEPTAQPTIEPTAPTLEPTKM